MFLAAADDGRRIKNIYIECVEPTTIDDIDLQPSRRYFDYQKRAGLSATIREIPYILLFIL